MKLLIVLNNQNTDYNKYLTDHLHKHIKRYVSNNLQFTFQIAKNASQKQNLASKGIKKLPALIIDNKKVYETQNIISALEKLCSDPSISKPRTEEDVILSHQSNILNEGEANEQEEDDFAKNVQATLIKETQRRQGLIKTNVPPVFIENNTKMQQKNQQQTNTEKIEVSAPVTVNYAPKSAFAPIPNTGGNDQDTFMSNYLMDKIGMSDDYS